MGGLHAARVDRDDAAGHDRGEHAAVPDEQPAEHHRRRAGGHGEDPPDRDRPGRAGQRGQRGGRGHQQRDPRRLHDDEVAVRHHAVDQPKRAAEVRAVVVVADAEQVTGPEDLEAAQPQREQRGGHDDRGEPA